MDDDIRLNVPLLRRRVPNLTTVAKASGLRPATVSNLCTGKISLAKAEVRTLVTLATLAGCTLDELVIRGGGITMMESGIKVLDLFAPLVRGGTVGLVARSNMGQLVLVQELFHRFSQRNYVTVFWSPFTAEELGDDDIHKGIKFVMDHAQLTATTLDQTYELIDSHRHDKEIILAADRRTVLSGGLWTLKEKLMDAGARPITTLLVDISGDAVDEDTPYGPLDTLLNFDINLVTRSLYPAVDPITSTSSLLEGAQLELTHITIQQRARKLLRRYKELRALVSAWGIERLSDSDKTTYHRGERLEAYLSQPFYVAEPFTKRLGISVSLDDTLNDTRRILDGVVDEHTVEQFLYLGELNF
ncbi:helix-turn-helix domain-containing protein [Sulfoacidibacillus ferrooxidans]|uniref:ATP synthase subunit beta n=1 Tax=Sulfoacidibacillus ferrooxidans TaxID=2005001 RepID=A0A9X2AG15_9BACL|nr:helix-turn-helix domain-containing protein [Sulfoacidibacillus ferrooxidans]MCI0184661.1 ATP synthase subunit beta [Sulfoacidibacillus ferrooxidans]